VLTIGWRQFDGSGVDATIRWDIYRCCVQSEQGFADANTSISADAVPHLQMFDICHFYFLSMLMIFVSLLSSSQGKTIR
jgi:hypothetical protein